ncbi:MAG: serine/threonine protein kinase [Kofleriaceae bacterium]|nr:serine/threonine protein kinase [Kofleriaceae bacterium]
MGGKAVDQPRTEATRLGSYEIVRKLARGGMAELFLARTVGPEGFEKLVVLKKILPKHADNPRFVRLFLDEAKLVATLDHPGIAHVYDMGKVDAHYFFTMEYVHGQDVRTTLRRTSRMDRKFPIDHAVQIARDVAAALHYAHERRRPDNTLLDVVHRDVSPSNILISYDGAVKLVDFGVAKAATSTVKTRTGTLKGKISYMSPEQAKGSPLDRRSDIFSLGIVLWEMVTTSRLFRSENDLATIQMIINSSAQPPSQINPQVSPELERIVLKALANNIDERYQTAEQLQLDLEELAREQKLKQSTVALRGFMHDLFGAEIEAWTIAQASGHTLTDHVLAATEMTTPVSESELEYLAEEDDYDLDDLDEPDSEQATAAPSVSGFATQQISVPPPPTRIAPPSIVVTDQTPAPFPIAPREWRPRAEQTLVGHVSNERRTKQVLIGGSIGFAVVVLVVAALVGDHKPPPAAAPVEPEESTRIEMKTALPPPPPPVEAQPAPVEAPAIVAPPPTEVKVDKKSRPKKQKSSTK